MKTSYFITKNEAEDNVRHKAPSQKRFTSKKDGSVFLIQKNITQTGT